MILIPMSEVPDLMESLNEKLLAVQGEAHTTPCPEAREALEEQAARIQRMIDRIVPSYRVWDGSDRAWCGVIAELAEEAENATATPAGRNLAFSDVRQRMQEEMTP